MENKISLATLNKYKMQNKPFSAITCYDYPTAVLLQKAKVDCILVGDSAAPLLLGYKSTINATMDLMITLTAAVRRGAPNVFLMGDMPFMSYQVNNEKAVLNAGRFLIEAECDAVKIEVDGRHADIVRVLSVAGIPTVAHMGYRPQFAQQNNKIVKTRELDDAKQLVLDTKKIIQAGACMILLECVTDVVAQAITQMATVPVISCGSGPFCDGQLLILHDLLQLPGAINPKFSKAYAEIGDHIYSAFKTYIKDVQSKRFPDKQHSYHMESSQIEQFNEWLKAADNI